MTTEPMTNAKLVSAIAEARTLMARLPLARELRSRLAEADRLCALLTSPLPEELRVIEARAEAATPGPWETDGGNVVETVEPVGDGSFEGGAADVCEVLHYRAPGAADPHGTATFIAHARADVPRLLTGIRAQAATIEERDAEIAALRSANGQLTNARDCAYADIRAAWQMLGGAGHETLADVINRLRVTGGEP